MIVLTLPGGMEKRLDFLAKKTRLSAERLAFCAIEEFLDIQEEGLSLPLQEEED